MRKRILRKSIAIFLLLVTVGNVVAPTVSYALTSGPTAPEATSFEPVDTTDMVNLVSGQFVYNMPLIEVPGPDGGYPLSLSYHSGIKVEQEASWIGLGWTLNPGAINRSVNVFPDDNISAKREVSDYWDGGESKTRTYSVGLNIPNSGIGFNYSLANTHDTFKGFSSESSFGISFDPISAFLNKQARIEKLNNSINANNRAFTPSNFASSIASAYSHSGGLINMGVSISSVGIKTHASFAGQSFSQSNGTAGKVSSYTSSKNVSDFKFLVFDYSVRDYYTRYWSDEVQELVSYGSLYPSIANDNLGLDHFDNTKYSDGFVTYASDQYDLYDDSEMATDTDPSKGMGGTLPAYDRFDVLGQGVGGVIQPVNFTNGDLFGQNTYEKHPTMGNVLKDYPIVEYKSMRKFPNKKSEFRFLNDFSNRLETSAPIPSWNGTNMSINSNTIGDTPAQGFNNQGVNQKLAGSRHIEWFTNLEIVNGTAKSKGFIDCYDNEFSTRKLDFELYDDYLQPEACTPISPAFGTKNGIFTRDKYKDTQFPHKEYYKSLKPTSINLNNKIGGFMITNETGVTYHYALPVYNSNEYSRQKLKNPYKGVPSFKEIKNNEPYASTWLLTAVTGPDYVDRNGNGILDNGDWGYWVKFDYGRWADSYQWRTPDVGYMDEIESEYETFSYGIKELYYLDAIETSTHKAIFIKSPRKDGRGVTSRLEGGSNPRQFEMKYYRPGNIEFGKVDFYVSPVSMMKLDAIYLFDKKSLSNVTVNKARGDKYTEADWSGPYRYGFTYTNNNTQPYVNGNVRIAAGEDFIPVKYHNGDLVYDEDDIHDLPAFKENAARIIEVGTDYSLSKNVSNSFGYFSDYMKEYNLQFDPCAGGVKARIGFDFEVPAVNAEQPCPFLLDEVHNFPCLYSSTFYSSIPLNWLFFNNCTKPAYAGDAVKFNRTGKLTLNSIKVLGKGGSDIIPPTRFSYDNNPYYEQKMYDEWGYYKSDYQTTVSNYNRRITETSAANSKAWSLSTIKTPLGSNIEIDYEPNTYGKSVYNDFSTFTTDKVEIINNTSVKLYFKEKGLDLNKWFSIGTNVNFKPLVVYHTGPEVNLGFGLIITDFSAVTEDYNGTNDVVTLVGSDYLIVSSPTLKNALTKTVISVGAGQTTNFNCTPYFITGFVQVADNQQTKFTGGVRVKSLTLADVDTKSIMYDYNLPNSALSSGVTSFKPYNLTSIRFPNGVTFFDEMKDRNDLKNLEGIRQKFQKSINRPYEKIMSFVQEAPSPGSLYTSVTVKSRVNQIEAETFTIHQFLPFKESMITRQIGDDLSAGNDTDVRQATITNNSIDVGNLINTIVFDRTGKKLSEKKYGYLFDDENKPNEQNIASLKQGVIERVFHKLVNSIDYKYELKPTPFGYLQAPVVHDAQLKALVTKHTSRSNVITSVEDYDYVKNVSNISENLEFDFYSGKPIKVLTRDEYGNSYLTQVTPAYSLPEYSGTTDGTQVGMGLKVFNIKNKHMLTQEAASYVYKVDPTNPSNKISLVSASAQTWSDQIPVIGVAGNNRTGLQTGIWRKKSTYSYTGNQYTPLATTGDGLVAAASFQPFTNWTTEEPQTGWQKNSTITKYDYNSHAIEGIDINDKYAATKFNYDHSQVLATAANAEYRELAFSGAEEAPMADQFYNPSGYNFKALGGGVYVQDNITRSSVAHTGSASIQADVGQRGFTYYLVPKDNLYQISFWSSHEDAKVKYKFDNGAVQTAANQPTKHSGNWYLISALVQGVSGNDRLEIWCEPGTATTLFDDFRIHPVQAAMTSYVYNNWGELTHILDNNNLYTKYEYDGMGRLTKTYRERLQSTPETPSVSKISEVVEYHYALKSQTPAFLIPIQTSVASGNGNITQNVNVLQGGTATINTANSCANLNNQSKIYADGKLLPNFYGPSIGVPVILYDGAKAYVENGVCKLVGVQGNHKVKVEFALPPPNLQPYAVCEWSQPNNCPTNRYFIMTPNTCGGYEKSIPTYLWTELSPAIQANTSPCPTIDPNSNCNQLQQ